MYLPTYFCQALLQGHTLATSNPDAPTGLSPLLTPPSSAGPANAQQQAMQIQVLLSMVQDHLSKEEVGDLLYQKVHVLTSNQDLCHSMRNFVMLMGDYLGDESPICLSMGLWTRHIDRFERQNDKAFARYPLFGADLMDQIRKRVQVLLHSCIPVRLWGYPEEGRKRGVVKFDTGMGGAASAEGGGTSEIVREQFWRKAKQRGRRA